MNDALTHSLQTQLKAGGLRGAFIARDLASGSEAGFNQSTVYPSASLVKLPLALTVLDHIHRGLIDPAATVTVSASGARHPVPGLSHFHHPAVIAIEDLLYLAVALSDNVAADELFALTPPAVVNDYLAQIGITGITVRHRTGALQRTPIEHFPPGEIDLAYRLAHHSGTPGGGHRLPQLDHASANTGTARSFADLLQAIWTPSAIPHDSATRVRALMSANVHRHRLTPDFVSDDADWASKTGTLLNLRHEIGVVTHRTGQRIAVVALTESAIPASSQPAADALIASTARSLHDEIRRE